MQPEKPLHVRVAEALGQDIMTHWPEGREAGYCHYTLYSYGGDTDPIPRYDTDWNATGPLIEKYQMQVWPHDDPPDKWIAESEGGTTYGPTLLEAVCQNILALKEAGKLNAA